MPCARTEAAAQRCQSRRFASRWVFLGVLALVMASGCRGAADVAPPPGKVILIGVDGLEWRVVLDLVGEERLPVLTRLMREGSFGRLETLVPTFSPVIWTTVATGKLPKKHGIEDGEWELVARYGSFDRVGFLRELIAKTGRAQPRFPVEWGTSLGARIHYW